jgi:hypothetical protein
MSIKRRFSKIFCIALWVLAALALVACDSSGIVGQVYVGKITICHATSDSTKPYDEISLDFNELAGHSNHQDDLIPAPASGCPETVKTDGNTGKIAICHATSSATNPYNEITVDFSGLRGHSNHKGDIIPAPENGCSSEIATSTVTLTPTTTITPTVTLTPSMTVTPTMTLTPSITVTPTVTLTPTTTATPTVTNTPATTTPENQTGKITICHATNSSKNPYVLITVSVNGLNGHGKHARDIIPAPAEGCPQ